LEADALNSLEDDIGGMLLQFGADPSLIFSGSITRNGDGATISATVKWPNGVVGVYSGTPSATFPAAIDSYTITYAGTPTVTVTQPGVTRDSDGYVTNSPALTIT
jgi:hypothetical protein